MIIRQSAKIRNPDGIAIIYPPQELFPSIKSIENNCKAAKSKDQNLRYQVRLGHNNIELWIKTLGDKEYLKVDPTVFGSYTLPKIDNITTLPNLSVSPPKGKTLKRTRESPETVKIPSKCQTLTIDDLMLQPSWRNTDKSPLAKPPQKHLPPPLVKYLPLQ